MYVAAPRVAAAPEDETAPYDDPVAAALALLAVRGAPVRVTDPPPRHAPRPAAPPPPAAAGRRRRRRAAARAHCTACGGALTWPAHVQPRRTTRCHPCYRACARTAAAAAPAAAAAARAAGAAHGAGRRAARVLANRAEASLRAARRGALRAAARRGAHGPRRAELWTAATVVLREVLRALRALRASQLAHQQGRPASSAGGTGVARHVGQRSVQ